MKNDTANITNLEKEFFSIEQLKSVSIKDNEEGLVDLRKIAPSIILVPRKDNVSITGNTVFLRSTVAQKLKRVQDRLAKKGLGLKITDGYRPIEIQAKYYRQHLSRNKKTHPELSKRALENLTIKFCAKPELSFHPTGGAVDLTIIKLNTKRELWMGTKIDVFTEKVYSFYPYLAKTVLDNRKILFREMDKENFYNLPSEWWHFSYGTIDWALYYKKPYAIYNVKKFKNYIT
ncbi:MAG: M15 family metallopeptidase [Pseudomonadota bacterium]|mgnify:CR=1 FL=1